MLFSVVCSCSTCLSWTALVFKNSRVRLYNLRNSRRGFIHIKLVVSPSIHWGVRSRERVKLGLLEGSVGWMCLSEAYFSNGLGYLTREVILSGFFPCRWPPVPSKCFTPVLGKVVTVNTGVKSPALRRRNWGSCLSIHSACCPLLGNICFSGWHKR